MALILSLKIFLISTAVLFTAVGLNVYVPLIMEFLATHVPLMWSFCLLCLKPPCLFLIINGIIMAIVASSRFHHSAALADYTDPTPQSKSPAIAAHEMKSLPHEFTISEPPVVYETIGEDPPDRIVKAVVVNGVAAVEDIDEKTVDDGTESTWTLPEGLDSTEKPHETLEDTWKAITEGRAMALTWQNRGDGETYVKKFETFKEMTNPMVALPPVCAAKLKLRKEPSMSQDKLNRRVEAFIRKFNEEMRLQKQQSLNQYINTINRVTDSSNV